MDVYYFHAKMGSCQCGSVGTIVIVNHEEKKIISQPKSYRWMSGVASGNEKNTTFHISYVSGELNLAGEYNHEVRDFTEKEKTLIPEIPHFRNGGIHRLA